MKLRSSFQVETEQSSQSVSPVVEWGSGGEWGNQKFLIDFVICHEVVGGKRLISM